MPILFLFGKARAERWRRFWTESTPLDVPDPLDEEVDDLLRKIHEHGEVSLTDVERDVLKVASERYKSRRR